MMGKDTFSFYQKFQVGFAKNFHVARTLQAIHFDY